MTPIDYSRFLKHLLALLLGQILLGAIMSLVPNSFTEEMGAMAAGISSPSIFFLLMAFLAYPAVESGVLVFFIWALGAMKANAWLVRIISGILFGMMHASFGVGKIMITAYAGMVYSNLFLRTEGGLKAYLQICALHMANNVIVIAGVALLARLHS